MLDLDEDDIRAILKKAKVNDKMIIVIKYFMLKSTKQKILYKRGFLI